MMEGNRRSSDPPSTQEDLSAARALLWPIRNCQDNALIVAIAVKEHWQALAISSRH